MLTFIDASAYLSLLNPKDTNHEAALQQANKLGTSEFITSQSVLGEVLTVGSQRFNKKLTVQFVQRITDSSTIIVLETPELIVTAWEIFQKVRSKNISWVDCYSQAIIEAYTVSNVFTFDADFRRMHISK